MRFPAFLIAILLAAAAWSADYTGPKPPKPDMLYLVHADNLLPTEASEAKQEKDTYSVMGATSTAKTPLAEPIFLLQSDKLTPESLELYRMEVKGGKREVTISKRRGARPLHLSVTRLERGLYRVEAADPLENGEYAISPSGSNRVFCFQVF
jgi:hypothetical protein